MQGRHALIILRVDIRPVSEQDLGDFAIIFDHRLVQGRLISIVLCVGVGAVFEQNLDGLAIIFGFGRVHFDACYYPAFATTSRLKSHYFPSPVQRRLAPVILRVDVGAVLEQDFNYLRIAFERRLVERCTST